MANFHTAILFSVVLIVSVTAYPRRPDPSLNGYAETTATYTGTCASIGYTTRCCPPDEDCMAVDNDDGTNACFCSSDCHVFEDCCSDIVNVCPAAPRTCTELGFIDRCCEDPMSLGFCEIESSACSCKLSCFVDNNCCPEIGCSPTNCAEAGLDPGCCTRNCNVTYTNGSETNNCYCDERCRLNGDCCEDVDQTKQCSSCTLTIMPGNSRTKLQEVRPKLTLVQLAERYQNRLKKFMGRSQASLRQSSTQRAYVDERNNMRERLAGLLESRRARAQVRSNNRRF